MKNYIEIQHLTGERQSDGSIDEDLTVYWAVRPNCDKYRNRKPGGPVVEEWGGYWSQQSVTLFGGDPVRIYNQSDIDGLRKLLDAIEAELKEDGA